MRPNKDGWQLQHVHGGGHHPLTSGCRAHRFWPLHRVHAYDAFSLRPVLNDPRHFSQLAQLPFEWPMARLSIDFPSVASSFAQNVSRLAVERTLQGQRLTENLASNDLRAVCVGGHRAGSVSHCPFILGHWHRFPGWLHLESLEFWQKALYIELAGECYDLAPMSRNSQSPTVHKRHADSISSFVVIQHQKQNANRLPIQNVKVYFHNQGVREPAASCIGRRSDSGSIGR